ncbi:MAG: NUDIX domain-containing protein [Deltaproteobacteria bacterium]|nr:NUDIX domain-containing protein [Deltaproteobacteria bacterium]
MRRVRAAVAAVLRNPENEREVLIVRRPADDDRLPNVWGLPAVTLAPGELPEAGLRRLGRDKLATEIEPVRLVGIRSEDLGAYELILLDVEARLVGEEPSVAAAPGPGTRYVGQEWTEDLSRLAEAARRGSLCARILLEESGLLDDSY